MATSAEQATIQLSPNNMMVRQLGVMLALAISVALGVAVVLWSQTPNYSLLYSSLGDRELSEVMSGLQQSGVEYKLEAGSGAILVPSSQVDELRLKLAGLGLPRGGGQGFELLEKETGFGGSQAIEKARIQRALEGEIARSIVTIQSVRSARVLLAIPKQSVFLRHRKKPSASVVVDMHQGRELNKPEVAAILHLVSSAVPQLDVSQVTVVDQKGALLSAKTSNDVMSLTSNQFEFKQGVEEHLINRVESILLPIVGAGAIRASVSADVDFTTTEQTQEQYNPDLAALRSEQVTEEQSNLAGVQGVPGALSNQPPAAGVAPEVAEGELGSTASATTNVNKRSIKNYELDKKISHTKLSSGRVKRITVAVVIDNKQGAVTAEGGASASEPYSDEDVAKFTVLVKEAVGFNALRGDSVTITNLAFRQPDVPVALPEVPLWEQAWVLDAAKQVVGGVFALILIFFVLRPTIKTLLEKPTAAGLPASGQGTQMTPSGAMATEARASQSAGERSLELESDEELMMLEAPKSYEQRLEMAQKIAGEDPKRVAQVMKTWIKE
ncbi:MAG: flagellar M-ring protein FliF [Cycloclasticus pugetii]|jgi:flagellar M-ring protein FliF|uniref:Flagellar M-ring protein n=1 Tax=Cycloclasticus zancles 78-ME TaxID=1198232 RepID=S5T8W6_9GAMM|nr:MULTISPECIES: flagellar basal-body MS-ring/collar protein FliF [Cycloclasticus]AFT66755.1 FliF, flagellar M-ring transmembrane protein [Cycloclasticus sp. P1]AGS40191.1 Flagellar M-ring protein FliF [Cycloclasticus zancles 78-ME]MDF1829093.1 flagellar basal-body MS-ring/collar protein FliF [Cycloclasticus pugetii]